MSPPPACLADPRCSVFKAIRRSHCSGGNRSYVARRFHSGETEAPLLLAATSPPATIDPALYLPPALR